MISIFTIITIIIKMYQKMNLNKYVVSLKFKWAKKSLISRPTNPNNSIDLIYSCLL